MRYKKITKALSMLMAVTMVTTAIPSNVFASAIDTPVVSNADNTSTQDYVYAYGDVDENGTIDLSDMLDIKNNKHSENEVADFNSDGVIDELDVTLLREYLVGKDVSLAPVKADGVQNIHTITFVVSEKEYATTEVDDRGMLHNLPEPPVSEEGVFVGWFIGDEQFYPDSPITSDLIVTAKFQKIETPVDLAITSFSEQEVAPSYAVYVKNIAGISNVKDAITVKSMDGSVTPELEVVQNGEFYQVTAVGGFELGSSYQIIIGDGLQFYGKIDGGAMEPKLESIKTANITILRSEENNLEFSKDMSYLSDTDAIKYYVEGQVYDYITSAPVQLGDNGHGQTVGYFEIDNPQFTIGQSLCIGQEDSMPDITNLNEETTAYVTITNIDGNKVYFETVTSENLDEIIFMPATIPFSVVSEDLIPTENGTVLIDKHDRTAWGQIYPNEQLEPEIGDFIVFYAGRFVELGENDKAYYGKVVAVSDGVISYETTTKEEIVNSMSMFQKETVKKDEVLTESQKEQIIQDVTLQAQQTGFAEDAAYYLADMATQTDGFKDASGIRDFNAKDENGNDVDLSTLGVGSQFTLMDSVSLSVEFSDSQTYFTDGVRLALKIQAKFQVPIDKSNKIIIELSAAFEQEIAVDVNASVDADVVWYLFIPVIKEITCKANVDLKNFSAVSIDVVMYSKEESIGEYIATNITSELKEMVGLTDGDEIDAGMKNLMDTYDEMLDQESDWITLCEQNIFTTDILIVIVAIGVGVDFVISANINIALGTGFEYVVGKRYSFWFQVFSGKSGSSEMDLLDEQFQFYFYVMGTLGLRMGVKANICVGIISTKIASVGFSAEVGPYIKLWGYFIYEYSKIRPMGSSQWTEEETMLGALYLEFGLYFIMSFEAQAFDGFFEYEAELFNEEWALLSAGERKNVYSFAYEVLPDEGIRMNNTDDDISNGITTEIPKSYRMMTYMDLVEGDRVDQVYNADKFTYTLSNPYFKIEQASGDTLSINVAPPQGVRYLESDLTITWVADKLAFSNRPISVTIPLFWTTLSNSEFKQKVQASVEVRPMGHPNDNSIVWKEKMTMGSEFDLPTRSEILELMEYNSYDYNGTNIKYDEISGYDGTHGTEKLTLQQDRIYDFNVGYRDYVLRVDGVTAGYTSSFTACYGGSFDISSLANTGVDNPSTDEYKGYAGLEVVAKNQDPKYPANQDVSRAIDSSFAKELIDSTNFYNAIYTNNAMKVEFVFEGVEGVESYSEIVKKGEVPENGMEEAKAALEAVYPNAYISVITPPISNVNANTTYQVVCMNPEIPPVISTIHYEVNGGILHQDTIQDQQLEEMIDINAPNEPTKEGHTFVGWFEDEELTKEYVFRSMPSYDLTVYAKWKINEYTINFDYQADANQVTGDETVSKNIFFEEEYGTLPTPVYKGYRFEGWFTEPNGQGTKVSETTQVTQDTTLYVDWTEKEEFSHTEFTFNSSVVAIYSPSQSHTIGFTVADNSTTDGDGTYSGLNQDDFEIKYQRKQYPGEDATSVAQNAGDYTVQIKREEDDNYKEFYYGFDNNPATGTSLMNIQKAPRTINASLANVNLLSNQNGFNISALSQNSYLGDGVVQYSLNGTNFQSSRYFANVGTQTVNVYAKVLEGENYLATSSTLVKTSAYSKVADNNYLIRYDIHTSGGGDGGTDAHIRLYAKDGSGNIIHEIDTNGYGMEKNSDDVFSREGFTRPWRIAQIQFWNPGQGSFPAWQMQYYTASIRNASGAVLASAYKYHDKSIGNGDRPSWDHSEFKRTSSFGSWTASNTVNLNATSSGNERISWSANVTDQYGTYNAYANTDGPSTTISGAPTTYKADYYHDCFDIGVGEVNIDKAKLYEKMSKMNQSQITINVSVVLPYSTTGTFTKTITINADI